MKTWSAAATEAQQNENQDVKKKKKKKKKNLYFLSFFLKNIFCGNYGKKIWLSRDL